MSVVFTQINDSAKLPTKGTTLSAGYDLYAAEGAIIEGGQGNVIVKTGVRVNLPIGTYGRIAMRSGLAVKEHLAVSAGVIDRDYKDEVGVVVFCTKNAHVYEIKAGERFAQLIPEKIHESYPESDGTIEETSDIASHVGFGSTGKF